MKNLKTVLLTLILIFFAMLLSACSIIEGLLSSNLSSISLETSVYNLNIGDTAQIQYTSEPSDHGETIKFSSKNEDVAIVSSDGLITATGTGSTLIKVEGSLSGVSATATVNVNYCDLESLAITVKSGSKSQDGSTPSPITFAAVTNAGVNPKLKMVWTITDSEGNEVKTLIGDTDCVFSMADFAELRGQTLTVKVSYGDVTSESVDFGWYMSITSIMIARIDCDDAVLGEELEFDATLSPRGSDENAALKWYVRRPGASVFSSVSEVTGPKFSYIPKSYVGEYVFKAVYSSGGVIIESNSVKVIVGYADIDDVTITADSKSVKTGNKVTLSLEWNKSSNDPLTEYVINWYKNGVKVLSGDDESIYFTPETDGSYEFYATVNDVISNVVTITASSDYEAIQSIKISSSTADDGEVLTASKNVVFTLAVSPYKYIKDGDYSWYVNGTAVSSGVSTDGLTFTLHVTISSSGAKEYHVQAVCGQKKSNIFTIVTKSSSSTLDNNYLDTYHYYGGYKQNRYITSQEEFNNIINYARETIKSSVTVYIDYSPDIPLNCDETGKINMALASYEESGQSPSISASGLATGEVAITLNYEGASPSAPTMANATSTIGMQSEDSLPTYSKTGRLSSETLYVDGLPSWNENVTTSNLLYKIISWGYKPKFSGTNSQAYQVYAAARSVLYEICDDEMTDAEKVLAIYDWICYEVSYDVELSSKTMASFGITDNDNKEFLNRCMSYAGYYLEGVFLNGRAVCDGKSKAFTLLCAMEGIESVRITGYAYSDPSDPTKYGGHAWNKVLIDADLNGTTDWYVIDTTWGDSSSGNGSSRIEILNHKYFLLSDDESASTHVEKSDRNYPEADGDYIYYRDFEIYEDDDYDLYIESKSELLSLAVYAKNSGEKSIEINLAYNYSHGKTTESDNFGAEINGALGCSYYSLGDDIFLIIFS